MKCVCILVLNWRSKEETVACIDSLKEKVAGEYALLIVDNNSGDGSVEYIQEETERKFTSVRTYKNHQKLDVRLENGEACIFETEENGGYAYGNNIGMQIAFSMGYKFVWILNNDTIVVDDALQPMLNKISDESCGLGVVGSVIKKLNGDVECYGGGVVFPCLGRVKVVKKNSDLKLGSDNFFLMGSSILVPKMVYEKVGPIDESYFMYFEEADWQRKMLKAGLTLSVAETSVVYHRSAEKKKSLHYYYYMSRSGVMFSRKYCAWGGYLACIVIVASMAKKSRFNLAAIRAIFTGLNDGFLLKKVSRRVV